MSEPTNQRTQRLLETATACMAQGNNAEAMTACDEIIRLSAGPSSIDVERAAVLAYAMKAGILKGLGRLREVVAICDEAVAKYTPTQDREVYGRLLMIQFLRLHTRQELGQ